VTYCGCENIPFKLLEGLAFRRWKEKVRVKFFRKKGQAVKNWHVRALMIDPKKTKLVLIRKKVTKQSKLGL